MWASSKARIITETVNLLVTPFLATVHAAILHDTILVQIGSLSRLMGMPKLCNMAYVEDMYRVACSHSYCWAYCAALLLQADVKLQHASSSKI